MAKSELVHYQGFEDFIYGMAEERPHAIMLLCERDGVSAAPEDGVLDYISSACGGDARKSINTLELLYSTAIPAICSAHAAASCARPARTSVWRIRSPSRS